MEQPRFARRQWRQRPMDPSKVTIPWILRFPSSSCRYAWSSSSPERLPWFWNLSDSPESLQRLSWVPPPLLFSSTKPEPASSIIGHVFLIWLRCDMTMIFFLSYWFLSLMLSHIPSKYRHINANTNLKNHHQWRADQMLALANNSSSYLSCQIS